MPKWCFKNTSFPERIRLWLILGQRVPTDKNIEYNFKLHRKEYISASIIFVTAKFSALLQRWGILQKIHTKPLIFFLSVLKKIGSSPD